MTTINKTKYKVFYNNYKDYKIFNDYETAIAFSELHNSPIEHLYNN